jgi:hypothetical protein
VNPIMLSFDALRSSNAQKPQLNKMSLNRLYEMFYILPNVEGISSLNIRNINYSKIM